MTTIGVLGAGVMGSGIAQVTAIAGYSTVCYDIDAGVLDRAREHVTTGRFGIDSAVERKKLTHAEGDAALERLSFTNSFADAAAVDVVIEAIPERIEMKVRVFRDLDREAPPATILASNTSGFPIAALAAATDRPDRVVGWHWASPAPVMRLAEIVRTPETSAETIAAIEELAHASAQEPDRGERRADELGLRRQPRLLRDDPRSESRRRRRASPRASRSTSS